MKVQLISDVHLEFLSPSQVRSMASQVDPFADVLVLAGDIGNVKSISYQQFMEQLSQKFPKVFVVAGNHEYYGHDIVSTHQEITSLCDRLPNISFLCSSYEDYKGFRWVGTTLWSHVDPSTRFFTNDIWRIKGMSVQQYNQLHQKSVDFLVDTITDPCLSYIVITHYLPSMKLIHEKYRDASLEENQWFASSTLEPWLKQQSCHIPFWFYGHTHMPSDKFLYQTRMVCNPYGYERENKSPRLDYVVSVNQKSSS